MRKVIAAFRALIKSYDKDLDPLDRLMLRNQFPPLPLLFITAWCITMLVLFALLLYQAFTTPLQP